MPNTWVCKIQQVSKVGTPDILMCMSGVFVAIELKSSFGTVTEIQKHNLIRIGQAGGVSMIIHPDNYIESMVLLESISRDMSRQILPNEVIQL